MAYEPVPFEPCGANTKSGNGPCKLAPVRGSKRCRLHGGLSLKGPAHPNWQGGISWERRRGHLPGRMLPAADEANRDSELASLRNEIIAADARIADLMMQADLGGGGKIFQDLVEKWREFKRAPYNQRGPIEDEIDALLELGSTDNYVWEEIRLQQDHKRKLVEGEQKRLLAMSAMIPAEKALAAFRAVLIVVGEVVEDRDDLAEISRRVSHIMQNL